MEKKGIKEITEIVIGLKMLAITGKKVMADGKIGFEDFGHLTALLKNQEVLMNAFAGLADAGAEAKDISGDEAIALITLLVQSAKEFQAA